MTLRTTTCESPSSSPNMSSSSQAVDDQQNTVLSFQDRLKMFGGKTKTSSLRMVPTPNPFRNKKTKGGSFIVKPSVVVNQDDDTRDVSEDVAREEEQKQLDDSFIQVEDNFTSDLQIPSLDSPAGSQNSQEHDIPWKTVRMSPSTSLDMISKDAPPTIDMIQGQNDSLVRTTISVETGHPDMPHVYPINTLRPAHVTTLQQTHKVQSPQRQQHHSSPVTEEQRKSFRMKANSKATRYQKKSSSFHHSPQHRTVSPPRERVDHAEKMITSPPLLRRVVSSQTDQNVPPQENIKREIQYPRSISPSMDEDLGSLASSTCSPTIITSNRNSYSPTQTQTKLTQDKRLPRWKNARPVSPICSDLEDECKYDDENQLAGRIRTRSPRSSPKQANKVLGDETSSPAAVFMAMKTSETASTDQPDMTLSVTDSSDTLEPYEEDAIPSLFQSHSLIIRHVFGLNCDLYRDVLFVDSKDATDRQIRIAYFRRGREILANLKEGDQEAWAKSQFHALGLAYEILSRPDWRGIYDQYGWSRSPLTGPERNEPDFVETELLKMGEGDDQVSKEVEDDDQFLKVDEDDDQFVKVDEDDDQFLEVGEDDARDPGKDGVEEDDPDQTVVSYTYNPAVPSISILREGRRSCGLKGTNSTGRGIRWSEEVEELIYCDDPPEHKSKKKSSRSSRNSRNVYEDEEEEDRESVHEGEIHGEEMNKMEKMEMRASEKTIFDLFDTIIYDIDSDGNSLIQETECSSIHSTGSLNYLDTTQKDENSGDKNKKDRRNIRDITTFQDMYSPAQFKGQSLDNSYVSALRNIQPAAVAKALKSIETNKEDQDLAEYLFYHLATTASFLGSSDDAHPRLKSPPPFRDDERSSAESPAVIGSKGYAGESRELKDMFDPLCEFLILQETNTHRSANTAEVLRKSKNSAEMNQINTNSLFSPEITMDSFVFSDVSLDSTIPRAGESCSPCQFSIGTGGSTSKFASIEPTKNRPNQESATKHTDSKSPSARRSEYLRRLSDSTEGPNYFNDWVGYMGRISNDLSTIGQQVSKGANQMVQNTHRLFAETFMLEEDKVDELLRVVGENFKGEDEV